MCGNFIERLGGDADYGAQGDRPAEVCGLGLSLGSMAYAYPGSLLVEATRVGSDTAFAHIAALVAEAQTRKAPIEMLADRISSIFVPVVLGLATLTFAGWLLAGAPLEHALLASVAVLIISCPCAMGLATPAAVMVGTGRGADLGILIQGGDVLERVGELSLVDGAPRSASVHAVRDSHLIRFSREAYEQHKIEISQEGNDVRIQTERDGGLLGGQLGRLTGA